MGQKTNPIGLRLGIIKTWDSRWFAKREYAELLKEDLLLRKYLKNRLAKEGVPKILIARMAMNILVNELIGIIPVLGDAFSFWFKSNARNYELLVQQKVVPQQSRKSDWIFVGAILGLLFLIVCSGLIMTFLLLRAISHTLSDQ